MTMTIVMTIVMTMVTIITQSYNSMFLMFCTYTTDGIKYILWIFFQGYFDLYNDYDSYSVTIVIFGLKILKNIEMLNWFLSKMTTNE